MLQVKADCFNCSYKKIKKNIIFKNAYLNFVTFGVYTKVILIVIYGVVM